MMELNRNRKHAKDLRKLADFYEAHAVDTWLHPAGGSLHVSLFYWDDKSFARAIKGMGGNKVVDESYATVSRKFGDITVDMNIQRRHVCSKAQIGTTHVPEQTVAAVEAQPEQTIPAHEEPVYKWDCAPFLAGKEDTNESTDTDDNEAGQDA